MKPVSKPRIKICCIKSRDEAWAAINAGAAALGFVSHMPSGPGVITEEEISQIIPCVPPPIGTFLLTSQIDPEAIIRQQQYCKSSTLQLCDYLTIDALKELRQALPGISLVQVIHVISEEDVERAASIEKHADAVLLDSGNPCLKVKTLGGTGKTHDWTLSRKIREKLTIPIFLAGGIKADNIQQAIREVAPFGIDLCSSVRTDDKLDRDKLAAFMRAVGL